MAPRPVFARLAGSGLVLLLLAAPDVRAQNPQPPAPRQTGVETITVTSRRVEEDAQRTPIAVTPLSGRSLDESSFQEIKDIQMYTPGLIYQQVPGQGHSAQIAIRGIVQTDPAITFDPSVGVYLDGIYTARLMGQNFSFLDLERVEILKGPQGTLYGKNTTAGAVNVISRKPDGTLGGWASATFGEDSRTDAEGAISFPILGESLSARIAFQSANRDGYISNTRPPGLVLGQVVNPPGDPKDLNNKGLKAAVRWLPDERSEVLVQTYRFRSRENSGNPGVLAVYDPNLAFAGVAAQLNPANTFTSPPAFGPADAVLLGQIAALGNSERIFTSRAFPPRDDLDTFGLAVTGTLDLDHVTLKSLTGHREYEFDQRFDGDGSPYPIFAIDNSEKNRQFTQEFQATGSALDERLNYAAGLFFFTERGAILAPQFFGLAGVDPANSGTFTPTEISLPNRSDSKIRSYAAYTQGTYSLSDRLRTTLGVRLTTERRTLNRVAQSCLSAFGGACFPLISTPGSLSDRFGAFSWEFGLDYQFTDALFGYAKVGRGFRSGGFDQRATDPIQLVPFAEETVVQYELGVKSDWLDSRVRVNAATYYSKYKDIQLSEIRPCPSGFCTVTDNVGSADVSGGELEVFTNLVAGLRVDGTLGLVYYRYRTGPFTNPRRTPQYITPFTFSLNAQYEFPEMAYGIVRAGLGYRYQTASEGSSFNTVGPLTRRVRQNPFGVLDSRISLDMPKYNTEIAFFVRNLLDREYFVGGLDLGENVGFGIYTRNWAARRKWGVEVTYRFGSETEGR